VLEGAHNFGCPGHEGDPGHEDEEQGSADWELEPGCSQTKYGCCPDFVSAATGPDFEGCTGPIKTSVYLHFLYFGDSVNLESLLFCEI